MNYITLNGVKSNTIKGLLIQSLPSISKPLMRTEIEEIDGRDGDIVTKLGYSAYDKEMEIGLYGNFNIDNVIKYFDSEGTVVFSNEPDKFYRYQIIEQIDFERLIRYRTATVVFHVQPFKYSAVDKAYEVINQLMSIGDYSETKNGITVAVNDGVISVTGTGTESTEFYIPINNLNLSSGLYTLSTISSGSNTNKITMRVIKDAPLNANSFGEQSVELSNGVVNLKSNIATSKTYNYIWLYIEDGSAINTVMTINLTNDNHEGYDVWNRGNVDSKPKYTIYGNNNVRLYINGKQVLTISMGDVGYIVIDSAEMNAYQDNRLLNRIVTGNYNDLALPVGKNTITWSGNVNKVVVENYTRWI